MPCSSPLLSQLLPSCVELFRVVFWACLVSACCQEGGIKNSASSTKDDQLVGRLGGVSPVIDDKIAEVI